MALFFSGAVTSSPIKSRQPLADQSCESLSYSLLSPASSYTCYSTNSVTGSPCSCRRSPRLLTNGYYVMTEDSFSWDDDGNVSLTPATTNVSYKENHVRIFRRRRRPPRRSFASLLSDMTETCQSWLDERMFGGVFTTPPAESTWVEDKTTDVVEDSSNMTHDHTEIISPPDKMVTPVEPLIQDEICKDTCHSKEQFTQSLGDLSEIPTTLAFQTKCCTSSPQPSGLTLMKSFLLFILIFTTIHSRCLLWGLAVACAVSVMIMMFMLVTKSSLMDTWWKAKPEDVTATKK